MKVGIQLSVDLLAACFNIVFKITSNEFKNWKIENMHLVDHLHLVVPPPVWKKNEALHDILESKLIKLGMTSLQVDKIKESVLSS